MVKLSSRIIPYLTGYVHTQTNPFNSYSTINTIKNAERIISLYKALDPAFDVSRVCIKIPSTWEGLQACRTLQAKGISTLATTLFSMPQVVLAADAGCTYIAPYVNELKVHFVEGYEDKNKAFALCHAAQSYYKTHSLHTQVLPASLTNISEVMALAGVHHITVSPPLLKQLSETPGTGAGTGKPNLFPEKSKLDGFEMDGYEDILGEDSEAKWRMACTLSDAGRDEEKLVQAINIFVGCQRKLEGFAVEVGKGL